MLLSVQESGSGFNVQPLVTAHDWVSGRLKSLCESPTISTGNVWGNVHGKLNASWKISSLAVNGQSFLVIDGYLWHSLC